MFLAIFLHPLLSQILRPPPPGGGWLDFQKVRLDFGRVEVTAFSPPAVGKNNWMDQTHRKAFLLQIPFSKIAGTSLDILAIVPCRQ